MEKSNFPPILVLARYIEPNRYIVNNNIGPTYYISYLSILDNLIYTI